MNKHTSRACAAAQRDYRTFTDGSNCKDITAWVNNMQSRGLAVNTIRQRVSLVRHWLGRDERAALPGRRNIREGKWLNQEQVQAMLAVIPNNERGRRDFALITILLITSLRMGQVRNLRWNDFLRNGRITTDKKMSIPTVIFDVLQFTKTQDKDSHPSNMLLSLSKFDEDYMFAATHHHCSHRIHSSNGLKKQPLSPQEINRRIQRYARLAGLETQGINVECLRRTHKEISGNIIINLVQRSLNNRKTSPIRWKQMDRDSRLHGIGRRSHRA